MTWNRLMAWSGANVDSRSAAALVTCKSGAEALALKFASPEYTTVTGAPGEGTIPLNEIVKYGQGAEPLPFVSVAFPIAPTLGRGSRNCTVPVGVPAAGATGVTMATKTFLPSKDTNDIVVSVEPCETVTAVEV
jgi:hypothetical protein